MLGFELVAGGVQDLDAIIRHVQAGFDSYTSFAPAGWQPPDMGADRERTAALLAEPTTFALLARAGGGPVGHVSFCPAREPAAGTSEGWRARPRISGLAHLWQLFVLEPWWGRGVADALHAAAVAEMRVRGFVQARLYTPTDHARARRFYERRAWTARADAFHEGLSLVLTEYRLALV